MMFLPVVRKGYGMVYKVLRCNSNDQLRKKMYKAINISGLRKEWTQCNEQILDTCITKDILNSCSLCEQYGK